MKGRALGRVFQHALGGKARIEPCKGVDFLGRSIAEVNQTIKPTRSVDFERIRGRWLKSRIAHETGSDPDWPLASGTMQRK
jgi:hypothetical protein